MSLTFIGSIFILTFFAGLALLSFFWTPHDPTEFVTDLAFAPPGPGIWLGSDQLGRDVLSRLIDSTRLTLGMALTATFLAHLIGDALGIFAAVRGGVVDAVLSRAVDVVLVIPKIIIGLVVVAALGPSIPVVIGLAAVVYGAGVYRFARALGRDLVSMDFITVAKSRGEGHGWIVFGVILPHVIGPLASDFALRMSFAILFLSAMGYIGLGVQPPDADWGKMAHEGMEGLSTNPWAAIAPALAIALVSIALNLLVDSVSGRKEGRG
ncbi:MAG: ABC transporter permease [Pikeienuella sp.]